MLHPPASKHGQEDTLIGGVVADNQDLDAMKQFGLEQG
jgi:hypothetical protein